MSDTDAGSGEDAMTDRLALVTGASGYIGGRLVPVLLSAGFRVRCLARSPGKLRDRPWYDQGEIAAGDAGSGDDVTKAGDGVDVAYYLVHSLGSGREFARYLVHSLGSGREFA